MYHSPWAVPGPKYRYGVLVRIQEAAPASRAAPKDLGLELLGRLGTGRDVVRRRSAQATAAMNVKVKIGKFPSFGKLQPAGIALRPHPNADFTLECWDWRALPVCARSHAPYFPWHRLRRLVRPRRPLARARWIAAQPRHSGCALLHAWL